MMILDFGWSARRMPDRERLATVDWKKSRRSYVAFLDADDEWMPTYLERTVQVADPTRRVPPWPRPTFWGTKGRYHCQLSASWA